MKPLSAPSGPQGAKKGSQVHLRDLAPLVPGSGGSIGLTSTSGFLGTAALSYSISSGTVGLPTEFTAPCATER